MAKRAALVTGGSGGIGLAIARRLAENGYAITLSSRREEKLLKAAETLAGDDYKVQAVAADVTSEEAVVELIEEHRRQWGRLDCLVNNAGIGVGQPVDQITGKHLDLQIDVNLKATVFATRQALPLLREAGKEHGKALIVNLASIAGVQSPPWLSVYGATKAAILGFSKSTQKEVGEEGIAVTAIAPGFVATDMTEFIQGQIPPEKMMRPDDIAEAVEFLLRVSPNCSIPELVMARPGSGPDSGGM